MTVPRLLTALAFVLACFTVPTDPLAAAQTRDRSIAQLTLPTTPPAPAGNIVAQGAYVTAPVTVDGAILFRIGAPANPAASVMPIAARIASVQAAIAQLLTESGTGTTATTIFDPRTLRIHTRRVGDAVVLEAIDAKHPDPLPIMTVTAVDSRANGTNIDALASEWQAALQGALVHALVLRQPSVERRGIVSVVRLAAILIVVTVLGTIVLRSVWRRMGVLESEIIARRSLAQADPVSVPEDADASRQRRRFFAMRLRTLKPAQRLNMLGAAAETLLWGLALAWLISATWSLSLFAETTPLSQLIAGRALGVATTIAVAVLVSRSFDALIGRTAIAWRFRRSATSEDRARSLLRVPTIVRAVGGAKNFLLVFVAALSVLGQVGVPIGSVVTIGGLTAIALSLAAQNFVRDFLNGFLVLFEDQYVVGDFVTINTYSGIVENLTLRMVQIRDAAGDVVTIPHSSVTSVVNQSRNWSRVDYRVPVDPGTDIARAIAIVRQEITALAADPSWAYGDEPIEWVGIDALSRDGIVVRASVRTAPLRQFELRRRINERVLAAFSGAGITLGAPLPA